MPKAVMELVGLRDNSLLQLRLVGIFGTIGREDLPSSSHLIAKQLLLAHYCWWRGELIRAVTLSRHGLEQITLEDTSTRYRMAAWNQKTVRHNIGVFKAYLTAKKDIEANGGTITRLIHEYEFLCMSRPFGDRMSKPDLASEWNLPINPEGDIVMPDLRIYYLNSEGIDSTEDIEVINTEQSNDAYKWIRISRAAGFTVYDVHGAKI